MDCQKYQQDLRKDFCKLRKAKKYVDICFVTSDGMEIFGHKSILSYLHPFWRNILQTFQSCDHDLTVMLPDYTSKEVEEWLEKLYSYSAKEDQSLKVQKPKRMEKFQKTCDKCGKEFKNVKTYHSHMMSHKPEKWKFSCGDCGKKFMTNRHLLMHSAKVHQQGLVCPDCGKSYSSDSNLKEHIKNVHNQIQYPCETCGKIFKSKTYLNSHLKLHTSNQLKICPHCEKGFKGRYYYEHLKTHDPSSWKHNCEICQEKFLTKYKLIEHEALSHTGQAHFPCDFCHQLFLTTARRALHKKTCRAKF